MNGLESPDINPTEESNKDNEATKLAQLVRAHGMGLLRGNLPKSIAKDQFGQQTSVLGFIQGESVSTRANGAEVDSSFKRLISSGLDYMSPLKREQPNLQKWIISKYKLLKDRQITFERKGLFGKREIINESICTYKGKHGEDDWILYEYIQPVERAYDRGKRPDTEVTLVFVVPPDIAKDIDEQVMKDVTFPDFLFKGLYPDLLGQDFENQIRRTPTEGIRIIDVREGSKNPKIEIKKYPALLSD